MASSKEGEEVQAWQTSVRFLNDDKKYGLVVGADEEDVLWGFGEGAAGYVELEHGLYIMWKIKRKR